MIVSIMAEQNWYSNLVRAMEHLDINRWPVNLADNINDVPNWLGELDPEHQINCDQECVLIKPARHELSLGFSWN